MKQLFWAGFLKGDFIPSTLSPTPNSAWAKLKNHPTQTAQDLSDIGFSVKRVVVAWKDEPSRALSNLVKEAGGATDV